MERYLQVVKRMNYVLFLALMASLPLPRKFEHIMLIVWAVSWLLELRFTKRENFTGWKTLIPGLGLAIWVLWECVSLLWGGPQARFRDCHASLLILPLILAFGVNENYQWKHAAAVLIISAIASGFLYGFTLFWVVNYKAILYSLGPIPLIPFELNYYSAWLSFVEHRLFYCIVLMIAFVLLWMLRSDCWQRWGKVEGTIYLVAGSVILLLTLFATGSRASLLTLIILAAVYGISLLPQRHRLWGTALIAALVIGGGVAAWQLHPRMKTITLEQIFSPSEHLEEVTTQNPRGLIWYYALQSPQDYVGCGLGVRQSEQYLLDRYEDAGWTRGITDRFHAHNQYLLVCMELGVVAMLLFIAYWFCLPLCYPKKTKQRDFARYLAIIFGLSMLTDCLFSSMEGVVYICALLVLTGILLPSNQIDS